MHAFEQQFFTVVLMVSTLWLCSSPINHTGTNKDDSDLNSGFFKCRVSLYKFLLFEMQNLKIVLMSAGFACQKASTLLPVARAL